jgi:ribosome-associated heat shock protein Hsp15
MTEAREDRVRIDVWLWRARLCKTRAEATRLISEGGVRLVRDGVARLLEKPSVTVLPGDALVIPGGKALRMIEVRGLGTRRGPPDEARALYRDLEAHLARDAEPLA